MNAATNLFCYKSEAFWAFGCTSVLSVIGLILVIAALIQAFRRYQHEIQIDKSNWKITLRGPIVLFVIGTLFFLSPFVASYYILKGKQVAIDSPQLEQTISWYKREVMQTWVPNPSKGKVVIDKAAMDVEVKGFFEGSCAAEFFKKICDETDELECENEPLWKIWLPNDIHIHKMN